MHAKSLFSWLLLLITILVLSHGNGYSISSFSSAGAQTLSKPNIVLIVTDDQHMHHLQNMPYLSSQPNGHWVTFTNAFENVSLCCPSRANILSGQYAHHTGVNTNGGAGKFRDDSTIATWLKSAGYQTALVGKYLNGYPFSGKPPIPPGWDYWIAFHDGQDYYNYDLNENGTVVSYGSTAAEYSTDVFYNKAITFLDSTSPDQPFFLYFSTQAPHQNFTPAPRHIGVYKTLPIFYGPNFNEADVSDKPAWVRSLPLLSSNTDNAQRKASETLLAVDEAIQGIMQNIEAKGQLDNTVIIFITDNGLSFGAHRWQEKRCVYEECIRTPLMIRYPWTDTRTESRLVQSIDLAPTIAELAQVAPTHEVDGRSLIPLLNNTVTEWRSSILLEMQDGSAVTRPFWAVRTLEWKYVELNTTGEKELYDLVNDPYELQNLANLPEYTDIQSSLAAELAALRSSTITTPTVTQTPSGPTHTPTVTRTRTPTFTPTATRTITPTFAPGSVVTSIFTPSADAYVRSPDPTVNYGTATTLRAYKGGSSQTNSHLRFSVAGITGPVQSAKLRLYVTDASSIGGGTLYRTTENNWTETGINYSNQPATTGSALATLGPVTAGTWVELDVSSVVTGDGGYTFGLLGNSSDVVYYGSREAANKPELVVAYTSSDGLPTRTPTTTGPAPTPTFTATATQTATRTTTGPTGTSTSTPTATQTRTPTFTSTSAPGGVISSIFSPSADAYVRSPDPTVNYGTATTLRAYKGGSSETHSHVRFSVTGIDGAVQSAKLRLYVTDTSTIGGGALYRTDDNNWTETGINYSNQPATTGFALATLGPVSAGSWIEIDVSSAVTTNGVYTFGLLGNSSDVAYYGSRESSNKPQLVVTYSSAGLPTPTATGLVVPTSTLTPTATLANTQAGPTSTRTQTLTPTSTPSGADTIFADSFESGNLSGWTSNRTDIDDLSVSSAAALIGSQGLQAVIDDNNVLSVTSDHPNAEPRYRARFYLDPNSISMVSGNAHIILRGYSGSSILVLRVEFGYSTSGYRIRAALVNDGTGWTNTDWLTISDAPHSIELDWRAATGAGANDGGLTLWIDGTQQASVTGIDNDTRRIDRVLLGALASIDTGTRGTYYFDAFESRRQTYIGP